MATTKKQNPIPSRRDELVKQLRAVDPAALAELSYGTERHGFSARESFRDRFRDAFRDKTAIETLGEVIEAAD